jgi:hypothetical protein
MYFYTNSSSLPSAIVLAVIGNYQDVILNAQAILIVPASVDLAIARDCMSNNSCAINPSE